MKLDDLAFSEYELQEKSAVLLKQDAASSVLKSIREQVQTILTGLAALYIASVLSHFVVQPFLNLSLVVTLGSVTLASLYGLRWWLGHRDVSLQFLQSAGSLIAVIALLNAACHLYLLGGLSDSRNLALLGVGLLCFFLPSQRLPIVLSATLGVWLIVLLLSDPTEAWLHFTFGLLMAAGLRLHSEFSQLELAGAFDSLRQEVMRRRDYEERLRASESRFAVAAEAAEEGIWDLDLSTDELYVSGQFKRLLGLSETETMSRSESFLERVHPEDLDELRRQLDELGEGKDRVELDCRVRHSDGSYVWFHVRGLAVSEGVDRLSRVIGTVRDISLEKAAEDRLYHQAVHDSLTGLANRSLFLDRVDSAIKNVKRNPDSTFAIIFLDLDHFKAINDSLGHMVGDQILRAIGDRLRERLREVDTIARFGGDEFVVLLDRVKAPSDALKVARATIAKIEEPFFVGGREVQVGASAGIALSSLKPLEAQALLQEADRAMYQAKERGSGVAVIHDVQEADRAEEVLDLENSLEAAFRDEAFTLLFHPIIVLASGRILGAELQAHWRHPEEGRVALGPYLKDLQNEDLRKRILVWTVHEVLQILAEAREELFAGLSLHVDVNASVLSQLVDEMEAGTSELDGHGLILELREEDLVHLESSSVQLELIRERGFRIAIDHFGTGAASLRSLKGLPADFVKIDGSFIDSLEKDEVERGMVGVMINLARDLGMQVAALGIENADQAELLKKLECDYGQGPYFSRLVDLETFEGLLKAQAPL